MSHAEGVPASSPTEGRSLTTYTLRAAPPHRAFLLAAVASLVGAVLLVVSAANDWSVIVTTLGVLILVAGIALFGLALWTMVKMQVRAELTTTGYTFRTPGGVRHGTWAETVKVTASESGRRITFHRRDESAQHVLAPVGSDDPGMIRLVNDVTDRLMRSRS